MKLSKVQMRSGEGGAGPFFWVDADTKVVYGQGGGRSGPREVTHMSSKELSKIRKAASKRGQIVDIGRVYSEMEA